MTHQRRPHEPGPHERHIVFFKKSVEFRQFAPQSRGISTSTLVFKMISLDTRQQICIKNNSCYQLSPSKETSSNIYVGMIVRKNLGSAVVRNHIKRRIRHTLRSMVDQLDPQYQYLIIARKSLRDCPYDQIQQDLLFCLRRHLKIIDSK